jgi:MFS family permease
LTWTLRIIALISLPVLVAACMLIRARKPKRSSEGPGSEWAKTLRMTLYKSEFLTLALSLFFIYLGSLIPFNYIPLYAESNGATSATANILLAVSYTGSLIGRVGTTWAADWLGRFNMLAAASILSGISILCWIGTTATDVPTAFAYGLSSGGVLPLGAVCVTQLSPDMKHCGLRISMMMTLCSVGVMGVGPLTGSLLQSSARLSMGYLAVFLLSGVATLFGGIFLIVGRLVWTSRTGAMNEEDGHLRKIRRD